MQKLSFLLWYLLILSIPIISSCSSSEKSSDTDSVSTQVDSTHGTNEFLSSKEKVHWTHESIYRPSDYMESRKAIAINFNDSSEVIDTLAFIKALGAETKIKCIDSTNVDLTRVIVAYKQSEICFFKYWDYGPKSMFHSALIRDKEIVLKNGVRVGLTKQEVLSKYPSVKVPADVIYLRDGDDSILRLEFKMNVLTYMEYWPESSLVKSFGGLDIYQVNQPYNPFKSDLNVKYFVDLLDKKTIVDVDTIVTDSKTEQGALVKLYSYHYLITNNDSQVELLDHSGSGTYLSFLSAILFTPKIVLDGGIQVGMPKDKFLEHFGLQEITSGYKTLWINTRGGKIRATFENGVVTSIELGNGRIGRQY